MSTPRPGNGSIAAPASSPLRARRRAHLLQAAELAFLRNGYTTTTMEQIAEEAGVSRQTFYNYFADKEALVTALAQQWIGSFSEPAEDLVSAVAAIDGSPGAAARLRHAIETTLVEMERAHYAGMFRLFIEVTEKAPALAGILRTAMDPRGMDLLTEAINEAIAAGNLRPVDAPATAALIGYAFVGSLVIQPVVPRDDAAAMTHTRLATALTELLVHGLV